MLFGIQHSVWRFRAKSDRSAFGGKDLGNVIEIYVEERKVGAKMSF